MPGSAKQNFKKQWQMGANVYNSFRKEEFRERGKIKYDR